MADATKPRRATIKRVIEYLESQGLEIMGPNVDVETGQQFGGCKCYSADDALKFCQLEEVWYDGESF